MNKNLVKNITRSTLTLVSAVCCILVFSSAVFAVPRNGKIAFTSDRDGNGGIYVMNPDGSNQTRLTYNNMGVGGAQWSPDGRKIAFISQLALNELAIKVMNADGTNQQALIFLPYGSGGTEFDWSPDSRQIVFITRPGGIYVINADGTNIRNICDLPHPDSPAHPEWSPNGEQIAFDSNGDLYVIDADGSDLQNLLNTDSQSNFAFFPKWSPDGSSILFHSSVGLATIRPDGTDLIRLPRPNTNDFDISQSWAPDGNRIVFERWVGGGDFGQTIVVASPDGTAPIQFEDPCKWLVYPGGPIWSPDGTKIVYFMVGCFGGEGEIYVRNSDGSGQRSQLTTLGNNAATSWQPLDVEVSLSGRVTTANGRGLGNAVVSMTDSLGVRRTATTSNFGYYSFNGIPGDTYTTSVRSKRYQFQTQTVFADENLSGIDFMGLN